MSINDMEWQMRNENAWVFGPKIRGLVRMVGIVTFDGNEMNYAWRVRDGEGSWSGSLPTFEEAVRRVEELIQA